MSTRTTKSSKPAASAMRDAGESVRLDKKSHERLLGSFLKEKGISLGRNDPLRHGDDWAGGQEDAGRWLALGFTPDKDPSDWRSGGKRIGPGTPILDDDDLTAALHEHIAPSRDGTVPTRHARDRGVLHPEVRRLALVSLNSDDFTILDLWASDTGERESELRTGIPKSTVHDRRAALRAALAPYVDMHTDDPAQWTPRPDRVFEPLRAGAIRDRATGETWVTKEQAAAATARKVRAIETRIANGKLAARTEPDGRVRVPYSALLTALSVEETLDSVPVKRRQTAPRQSTHEPRDRMSYGSVFAKPDRDTVTKRGDDTILYRLETMDLARNGRRRARQIEELRRLQREAHALRESRA